MLSERSHNINDYSQRQNDALLFRLPRLETNSWVEHPEIIILWGDQKGDEKQFQSLA